MYILTYTNYYEYCRSATVETIDPENELAWRVDCAGGGDEEGGMHTHTNTHYANVHEYTYIHVYMYIHV